MAATTGSGFCHICRGPCRGICRGHPSILPSRPTFDDFYKSFEYGLNPNYFVSIEPNKCPYCGKEMED